MLRVDWLITLLMVSLLMIPGAAVRGESGDEAPPELTPRQLEQFNFKLDYSDLVVSDLSLGQRYVMNQQRREVKDLIARHLGIMSYETDRSSLRVLQQLADRNVILESQVRDWQSIGIVFGDILANEFGLKWVSYEDNLGVSKVLRWRDTENYVFPVTLFSKRIQFGDPIDFEAVFNKLEGEIRAFKEFENNRVEFKS